MLLKGKIDLSKESSGVQASVLKMFVYGPAGVGKSTFASEAPEAYFVDADHGSKHLKVKRYSVDSWDEGLAVLDSIASGELAADKKTIVIDTVTKFEEFLHAKVFKDDDSVENYKGGYGRGDGACKPYWRQFMAALERIRAKGKGVILIGHSTVKQFADPLGGAYDRYQPQMQPKAWGPMHQWADYTFFALRETSIEEIGGRKVGMDTGKVFLHTSWSPAWEAKARSDYPFPEELELSWEAFEEARSQSAAHAQALHEKIDAQLVAIGDKEYTKTVKTYLAENAGNASKILSAAARVEKRLMEKQEKQ